MADRPEMPPFRAIGYVTALAIVIAVLAFDVSLWATFALLVFEVMFCGWLFARWHRRCREWKERR